MQATLFALSMLLFSPWTAPGFAANATPPVQQQRQIGTLELDLPADDASSGSAAPAPSPVQVHNGATSRSVANHGAIYLYDHIVTAEGQTVSVRLEDKSVVMIAPSSDVTLNQFVNQGVSHGAQILVDQGMVHVIVPKNVYSSKQPFLIRTKTAVMGVRGTEFLVEQLPGGGGSTLHTLDGAVSMGKSVESLSNSHASSVVEAGKMSAMEAKDLKPSEPKRFNRKTLFTYLGKRAPSLAAQIDHQARMRRRLKDGEGKGDEKKKKPEWKKPPARRQVGK
jgi:hypothetical protein